MKKLFFTLLFLSVISSAFTQIPSCDGNRYKNSVFGSVDSIVDIQYGRNYTMNDVLQNLTLNLYYPEMDTVTKRPLIIFLHGGSFVRGDKQETRELCTLFALRGFVTATIDYRLIDVTLTDSNTIFEGLVDAMSDTKAAIRFFVEDAATLNLYKIDTNYIFISGVSAGGIIASHVAYLDSTDNIPAYISNLIYANGGFSGNSSANTSHTTPIKGVLNYSGALMRKDFISTGEPALFSAHDDGDTIVPCNHGLSYVSACPVYCDGSCAMQQEANLKGVYNDIFLNHTIGHCAYFFSSSLADSVIEKSADFLYRIICTTIVAVNNPDHLQNKMQLTPNPADETIRVEFPTTFKTKEQFLLFNSMGLLLREVEAKQSIQINISDLPKGLYFIHLKHHPDQTQSFIKL
ncbi:MAG: alpha/beta hydrolase fold domain-containing protein [Bacteroidales bacterium]|nr:alpha/beta hydrolase fold domain-containing protein [Bacteroidales bacterium]